MADETQVEVATTADDNVSTDAGTPAKKQRALRGSKMLSNSGKVILAEVPKKTRKKRIQPEPDNAISTPEATSSVKAPKKTPAQAKSPVSAGASPVTDDFADLVQLEEENARLRKALAEKLRAENADLRKKLGV